MEINELKPLIPSQTINGEVYREPQMLLFPGALNLACLFFLPNKLPLGDLLYSQGFA